METIDKIKAEIERQLEELGMSGSVGVGRSVLLEMLDFVKSLEKEPEVDLEKEIEDYINGCLGGLKGKEIAACARYFYNLGSNVGSNVGSEPKIKGWVARDKDKELCLYAQKPHRILGSNRWHTSRNPLDMEIDKKLFSDLKWEDEPIEVELIIRKKEE